MTPSQTVGPYFSMRLPWPDGPFVVPEGTPGAITIVGRLYDGAGNIIPDGLIETWQAGPDGRFAHPDDPRGATPGGYQSFRGFGRCPTAPDGSYRIVTLKPGPLPASDGNIEAPQIVQEFQRSFAFLRAQHPNIPLGSHPGMYGMNEKFAKLGKGPNPYIDPAGFTAELDIVEGVFKSQFALQALP